MRDWHLSLEGLRLVVTPSTNEDTPKQSITRTQQDVEA